MSEGASKPISFRAALFSGSSSELLASSPPSPSTSPMSSTTLVATAPSFFSSSFPSLLSSASSSASSSPLMGQRRFSMGPVPHAQPERFYALCNRLESTLELGMHLHDRASENGILFRQ